MQTAILKNWYRCCRWCPTGNAEHLHGIVYQHPELPDGGAIITTPIVWIDLKLGLAQTRHTLYALGGPKDFEEPRVVAKEVT